MATAYARNNPECAALQTMTADLCSQLSMTPGPHPFGNMLLKHSFVNQATINSIMTVGASDDYTKVSKMLNIVSTYIKTNPFEKTQRFNLFVYVIAEEIGEDFLAQQLISTCQGNNSQYVFERPAIASRSSARPPPAQQQRGNPMATPLTYGDLGPLQEKLSTVAHEWNNIGVQLGFHPGVLAGIRSKSYGDPMTALAELLTQWLQRVDPPPTLGALCAVMGGGVIRRQDLDARLRQEQSDFPTLKGPRPSYGQPQQQPAYNQPPPRQQQQGYYNSQPPSYNSQPPSGQYYSSPAPPPQSSAPYGQSNGSYDQPPSNGPYDQQPQHYDQQSYGQQPSYQQGAPQSGGYQQGAQGGGESDLDRLLQTVDNTQILNDGDWDEVTDTMRRLNAKWRDVGRGLKVDTVTLDCLFQSHHHDPGHCMAELLKDWLDNCDEPSWRILAKVAFRMNKSVAKEIAQKHPATTRPPNPFQAQYPPNRGGGGYMPRDNGILSKVPPQKEYNCLNWRDDDGTTKRYRVIQTFSDGWEGLGKVLGFPRGLLKRFETQHLKDAEKCLDAVLAHWHQDGSQDPKYGEPTWQALIDALDEVGGFARELGPLRKALMNKV